MDSLKAVRRFIKDNGLFRTETGRDARVLVALSGGPDSVALLHILRALNYECMAVHVNFHLRGSESDRDEAFAVRFCRSLGVPCLVEHLYAADYAAGHHVSIEMAAREMRYARFEEIRQTRHLDFIAVGHHRDDNVETFFLNLLRGSGIRGLAGMRPCNGFIVRPLLSVSRKGIMRYLSDNGLEYVTDHTNLETNYKRNKIRLQLMPLLEEIEPSAASSVERSMGFLSEVESLYASEIAESLKRLLKEDGMELSVEALEHERVPQGILNSWLSPYGFNTRTIVDVWNQRHEQTGRQFDSPQYRLLIDRGCLVLKSKEEDDSLPELTYETVNVEGRDINTLISKDPFVATLDADKLQFPLSLRHPRPGDRFVPYGMRGSRLVSDYLTDLKLSRFEKERIWLLVTPADEIVWVLGHRVAQPYSVDGFVTTRIIRAKYQKIC